MMIAKLNIYKAALFLLLAFGIIQSNAQPFAKEIAAFKQQDSLNTPPKHSILLIGSSSFTKWTDAQSYFPSYKIFNRAFGGSTLTDQIRYVNEVVIPYQPKQVLVYCGENDLASSDTVTANMVLNRFQQLFGLIRAKLPNTSIVFVAIKPSPSRPGIRSRVIEANALIRAFLKKQKATGYVDVYPSMIDKEGEPVRSLFLADDLHMNEKGYAIWQKLIAPYLLK